MIYTTVRAANFLNSERVIIMKSSKLFVIGSAVAVALAVSTAQAGSMRCGTEIIEDGQLQPLLKAEVEEKCGKPPLAPTPLREPDPLGNDSLGAGSAASSFRSSRPLRGA